MLCASLGAIAFDIFEYFKIFLEMQGQLRKLLDWRKHNLCCL
ncbi:MULTISPECIES: hypothetical protein [Nostocaceae]|nr:MULTISPECIES: hypothetical protein [Nostocaceae]